MIKCNKTVRIRTRNFPPPCASRLVYTRHLPSFWPSRALHTLWYQNITIYHSPWLGDIGMAFASVCIFSIYMYSHLLNSLYDPMTKVQSQLARATQEEVPQCSNPWSVDIAYCTSVKNRCLSHLLRRQRGSCRWDTRVILEILHIKYEMKVHTDRALLLPSPASVYCPWHVRRTSSFKTQRKGTSIRKRRLEGLRLKYAIHSEELFFQLWHSCSCSVPRVTSLGSSRSAVRPTRRGGRKRDGWVDLLMNNFTKKICSGFLNQWNLSTTMLTRGSFNFANNVKILSLDVDFMRSRHLAGEEEEIL